MARSWREVSAHLRALSAPPQLPSGVYEMHRPSETPAHPLTTSLSGRRWSNGTRPGAASDAARAAPPLRPTQFRFYRAVVFFVIAIIAAVFGFTGIAAGAASIAKILFVVFLILFILSLLFGGLRRGPRI
jgi:uncharacterized membrane protein YtjA (UPF0391 family)